MLFITSGFAFASELKGCVKTDIGELESIFSCPTGDYRVIYDSKRKKIITEFKKIGEPAKVIQYITNK